MGILYLHFNTRGAMMNTEYALTDQQTMAYDSFVAIVNLLKVHGYSAKQLQDKITYMYEVQS